MAQLKVTLTKSTIACLKKQKATIEALGLKKVGQSKIVEDTPVSQGMIKVVSHLVSVEKIG